MSQEGTDAPNESEAPPASGTGEPTPGSSTGAASESPGSTSGAPQESTPGSQTHEEEPSAGPTGSAKSSAGSEAPSPGSSKGTSKSPSKRKGPVGLDNCRIGFLGAGKLAEAIVKGLVNHKAKIEPNRIAVASKSGRSLDHFKQEGCVVTKRTYDLFAKLDCDVVFIVVHGFVIRQLFGGGTRPMALTTNYIPNQRHPLYVLSLVGGISIKDLKLVLLNPETPEEKYKLKIHRIMLNCSVAYGLGLGTVDVDPDSKMCSPIVRDLLTSFAKIELCPENVADAACALGGNGLAYVHYFVNALSDGGVKMGLGKSFAVKLAAKTLQSAALALLETRKHPSDLGDQCTSPSGPAIYGIHVLNKQDAGSGMAAAVEGAFKRIRELVDQTSK